MRFTDTILAQPLPNVDYENRIVMIRSNLYRFDKGKLIIQIEISYFIFFDNTAIINPLERCEEEVRSSFAYFHGEGMH